MLVSCLCFALIGSSTPAPASPSLSPELVLPVAGIDYPTDTPMPSQAKEGQVLLVAGARIWVDGQATLTGPESGLRCDGELAGGLRTGQSTLPICLKPLWQDDQAAAVMWSLQTGREVALQEIFAIEAAQAGIDYPDDAPPEARRHFHVLVTRDELRFDMGDSSEA